MSDFESALITAIIDERNVREAIKAKITPEFFFDTQTRAAYSFLIQWFNNPQYGDVPSWESFAHSFPHFEPVRIEESVVAICDKLRHQKLYSDIATLIQRVGEAVSGDPLEGFELLKEQVVSLTASHTVDDTTDIRSRLRDIAAEYNLMKSGATGLKGRPYPWEALNDATLGLQDQQLVFIYGRPKSGKTWTAMKIAAHMHAHGAEPLIFSQELSDIEIARRYVALNTGVDYDKFMRGALPEDVERDFFEDLEAFAETPPVMISQLTSIGNACLTELSAKIDEYRSNLVIIDGVYFLGSDWKELSEITRGLKRIAKAKKIPIIGVTQANRSRGKKGDNQDGADDFAYGDSFYQDCDMALRITRDIENRRRQEAQLFTAAIREGKSTLFTINMKLAEDMTQKSVQHFGDQEGDVEDQLAQDAADAALDGEEDVRE